LQTQTSDPPSKFRLTITEFAIIKYLCAVTTPPVCRMVGFDLAPQSSGRAALFAFQIRFQ